MSAFDGARSGRERQYPDALLAESALGAVGWSSPTLDSAGDAVAVCGVAVGDTMVLAIEYTAATPDPAAAKAEEQYDGLGALADKARNGS